jgi:hypothetical protein
MDVSGCPFTLDDFYLVTFSHSTGLQVRWVSGLEYLTPFELAHIPQERLDWIKQIEEEYKPAEKAQEVA